MLSYPVLYGLIPSITYYQAARTRAFSANICPVTETTEVSFKNEKSSGPSI